MNKLETNFLRRVYTTCGLVHCWESDAVVLEWVVKDKVWYGCWLEEWGYLAVGVLDGVEYFEYFWEACLGETAREVYSHAKEAKGSARV